MKICSAVIWNYAEKKMMAQCTMGTGVVRVHPGTDLNDDICQTERDGADLMKSYTGFVCYNVYLHLMYSYIYESV